MTEKITFMTYDVFEGKMIVYFNQKVNIKNKLSDKHEFSVDYSVFCEKFKNMLVSKQENKVGT